MKKMYRVNNHFVADQTKTFAYNVIVTAVEGGINYWCSVDRYDPKSSTSIIETGDGDDHIPHNVDAKTVENAIALFKNGAVLGLCEDKRVHLIGQSYLGVDDLDIDAEDADILVQVGLFGKVVYG